MYATQATRNKSAGTGTVLIININTSIYYTKHTEYMLAHSIPILQFLLNPETQLLCF